MISTNSEGEKQMRAVYQGLGLALVGLAIAGAMLPLLPSTPFLLLASTCFMRSNPKWNDRLLRSPLLGPALHDWNTRRCVRPGTKCAAIGLVIAGIGTTIAVGRLPFAANAALTLTAIVASLVVLRLPGVRRTPQALVAPCRRNRRPVTSGTPCHEQLCHRQIVGA